MVRKVKGNSQQQPQNGRKLQQNQQKPPEALPFLSGLSEWQVSQVKTARAKCTAGRQTAPAVGVAVATWSAAASSAAAACERHSASAFCFQHSAPAMHLARFLPLQHAWLGPGVGSGGAGDKL